jgi:hypothetical protein
VTAKTMVDNNPTIAMTTKSSTRVKVLDCFGLESDIFVYNIKALILKINSSTLG